MINLCCCLFWAITIFTMYCLCSQFPSWPAWLKQVFQNSSEYNSGFSTTPPVRDLGCYSILQRGCLMNGLNESQRTSERKSIRAKAFHIPDHGRIPWSISMKVTLVGKRSGKNVKLITAKNSHHHRIAAIVTWRTSPKRFISLHNVPLLKLYFTAELVRGAGWWRR